MNPPNVRVLVVEDDEQVAHVIAAVIAKEADEVIMAGTMRRAWFEVNRATFDLVLLNLHLPDSSLANSINSIRALLAAGAHRVVIVTAADVDAELVAYANDAGASSVISKNCGLAQALLSAVAKSACPA